MSMIDRLRELEAKATKGPWHLAMAVAPDQHPENWDDCSAVECDETGAIIAGCVEDPDANLIVAAVNALPLLLRVAECAERAADNWRTCGSLSEANRGNALDDLLSAVLAMRSEQ